MIRKPNSIIVLLFIIKIIPSLKTWLKHAYHHQSIDVKFIFDSARLGLSSSANILQIADVAPRGREQNEQQQKSSLSQERMVFLNVRILYLFLAIK